MLGELMMLGRVEVHERKMLEGGQLLSVDVLGP